jgi:hypothetical protein
MMSTVILTAMDTEQVGMQTSRSDTAKPGEATFAQTFEDRVGEPVEMLKKSADEAEAGLQNVKNKSSEKSLKEVSDITARGKGSGPFIQGAAEQGSKNSVPAKRVDSQPPLSVSQSELKTKELKAEEAAPVVDVEGDDDESSIVLPTSQTEELQTKDVLPGVDEKKEVLLETGGQPILQKKAAPTARMQEVASAKKTGKTEATQAAPMAGEKNASGTAHSIEAKHAQAIAAQGAASVAGQPVLPIALPGVTKSSIKPEIDTSSGGGRGGVVFEVGRSSVAMTNVTAGDSGRKVAVHDAKPFALDVERTSTATSEDKTSATDAGTGLERASGAANAGSDGDLKTLAVSEVNASAVHAMTSSTGILSGVPAGAGVPGDRSPGKLQNSDAVVASPVLPSGSKVQDGLGGATGPMETMPRMLAASPTALEVGIQNGTHGWLKVRAEMTSDGVVNASVSASSFTGQEMLHRELPSLTAYLQSEKVAVNTVTVPASLPTGAEPRGLGAAVDAGGSGQAFQRSNEGGEQRQGLVETTNASDEDLSYQTVHGVGEDRTLPLVRHMGGGSWLSVRA